MRSHDLFERSRKILPGGVDSPVRSFRPHPFFVRSAHGSRLLTEDGIELIDYCMAYGPLIFGHAPSFLSESVKDQIFKGTVFGTPHLAELELAEEITRSVPSMEMVRFVNSGGEAAMSAIRLSRAFTKRDTIVKFDGCYHGAVDPLLVNGVGAKKHPTSDGIPTTLLIKTKVIPFNDFSELDEIDDGVACVIAEPVMGNMGVIPPEKGFLQEVRRACDEAGAVLIFDEVITGFRLSRGGAQKAFNIKPDITLLGKIVGGGFPVGVFGGKRELMEMVAPAGRVYNAGTFNGNPVTMAAGLAVLKRLEDSIYSELELKTEFLCKGLKEIFGDAGIPTQINRIGSMFTIFFTQNAVKDAESARRSRADEFLRFHSSMLERGVFLPPSQFESCFLSTAHGTQDIEETLQATLSVVKVGGWYD